jgi:hypothetical protein
MKMSSCRAALERGPVTQHRPHDVKPPAGEGNQGLGVPLAFSSLAILERSGLQLTPQARESRLVEDPL